MQMCLRQEKFDPASIFSQALPPKEEQRCESALLKERWSLIVQSGTSRESIKIRLKDGVIMVDSKLYGKWDSTTNTLIKKTSNLYPTQ